jgi:hypothetical protein
MDLNTVEAIMRPGCRAEIPAMGQGDAVLAGGTWLFSEPQTDLRRLLDVTSLGWPALERIAEGLRIGATCTLAELEAYEAPESWRAAEVIGQCCRALLGSFKIRKIATVGGNLCLALPAAPMAALIVALDGTCEIWTEDGGERSVPAGRLITGAGRTALLRGEILRDAAADVADTAGPVGGFADRRPRRGGDGADHHRGGGASGAGGVCVGADARGAGGCDRGGGAGLARRYSWPAGVAAARDPSAGGGYSR